MFYKHFVNGKNIERDYPFAFRLFIGIVSTTIGWPLQNLATFQIGNIVLTPFKLPSLLYACVLYATLSSSQI